MGHRHLFGTPQMPENEHDQSWNMHAEQTYGHIVRGAAGENSSFICPLENVSPDGDQFATHWNTAPRSNRYFPTGHDDQLQPCQPQLQPCQPDAHITQDPFMPQPNVAPFGSVPEIYFPCASSSSYPAQGGGFTDITMGSGRTHQKRKSPAIPAVHERGSTSRYYCSGTSSDNLAFSEYRQDRLAVDAPHMAWNHLAANGPGYGGSGLSVRGECSLRNVRSRPGINFEANPQLPDNPSLRSFSVGQPIDHSSLVDIPGPSANALTTEWSHVNISSPHGRILLADPHGFSNESTHLLGGSNPTVAPSHGRGYDFMTCGNPVVPQIHHCSSRQFPRGPCNSYHHRCTPAFRPSNSTRLGNVSLSDEGNRSVADNLSRHPRMISATGWHNSDRNRRSRVTNERYRSLPDDVAVHHRMDYEGFTVVDCTASHASRSTFDQHRELRLDIDNMSYEELLALGERIGTVSTGLSEESILKCLKETVYCLPVLTQDEDNCAICLETYREADQVGTLKTCSHHYHSNCIRKWLSMKNSCPICKASALADDLKNGL
ncbi:hypothetical protein SAY87_018992 [Trapa incisa]|uniref:RING-type E3 ubiquitin transferase n=1 Tax=Trapa incisa TaxID=236973 RepID=A0AAN7K0V7_9MYRT|nr:hypothetical protein SAY87_018992 [Trapa incisa]